MKNDNKIPFPHHLHSTFQNGHRQVHKCKKERNINLKIFISSYSQMAYLYFQTTTKLPPIKLLQKDRIFNVIPINKRIYKNDAIQLNIFFLRIIILNKICWYTFQEMT